MWGITLQTEHHRPQEADVPEQDVCDLVRHDAPWIPVPRVHDVDPEAEHHAPVAAVRDARGHRSAPRLRRVPRHHPDRRSCAERLR